VGVLVSLAPADLRRVVSTYRDALRRHQEELNRLNVYPVPDGDTGTNMALTLESVVEELPGDSAGMQQVCEAIKHGSLMGARGNSGVILSQILRGLADTFSPLETVSTNDLVTGLRRATDAAYQAVLRPVEGTILTVVRLVAEAAEEVHAQGEASLERLLDRAADAAREAVARTPELLPVLRDAGVVDAGGRGFELLVAACLNVVTERPIPEPETIATPASVAAHMGHAHGADHLPVEGDGGVGGLRYEVMYFLHAPDDMIDGFRNAWGELGDSIVVVGGDGLWNCHVHTDDIGPAIEAGIAVGRPEKIRVTDLLEQVEELEEEAWVREGSSASAEPAAAVTTGVVAVAVGDGLTRLLTNLGVEHVVAGGQSMNPSTAQILDAVRACAARSVIVLPNNKNIVPVAKQVPDLADRPVAVVPTTAVVEALSALVAYDADASLDDNSAAMHEAASRVRAGEVTQAVRDSVAECGPIAAGDWIAISKEGVIVATKSAADAAIALVEQLVADDAELITLVVGADADSADTARITEHVELHHPDVEIEIHEGDQPLYPFLIGVE
jgi:DAK2 domain fusion protein YloV